LLRLGIRSHQVAITGFTPVLYWKRDRPIVHVFVCQTTYNVAQSEVTDWVRRVASTCQSTWFGNSSVLANHLLRLRPISSRTKQTLDAAATAIAPEAIGRGVISKKHFPLVEGSDDSNEEDRDPSAMWEYGQQKVSKLVELA
jgi:hypothetical protein